MTPTIDDQEEVITFSYIFSEPKIGDIIVFQYIYPPFIFCKRITRIVNSRIWVEGDNKKESIDSRSFGYIERRDIVGKVLFKL